MLSLFLILLVLWVVLAILLAAWTLWFSGYLYNEPTDKIYWRAPAAGAAVLLAQVIWVWTDYRAPGQYQVFWYASESAKQDPYKEIRTVTPEGEEEVYLFSTRSDGKGQYKTRGGRVLTTRPRQIIVLEGEEKVVYEPDRDPKGNFKPSDDGNVYYRDSKGRVLVEGQFHYREVPKRGRLLGGFVLHFLVLIACFLSLWLLLRFQWPHALGQAFVLWGVLIMFVMPVLLSHAEEIARQRATPKAQA